MSAAQRRRQRRLRSWWRHEQQSTAAALATSQHHSALRGQKKARAGEGDLELNFAAKIRRHPPPQAAGTVYYPMDVDDVPAASGSMPDRLLDVSGPQERVQRRTMEQIVDYVRVVPLLDAPVPLMVEQLVDVLRFVDALVPVSEQVIEAPKIILENIPSRRLVRDPQLAEQLVDVPTPFPVHVPVPRMEDQLVEVPQIVTHIVPQSFFVSTDGHVWWAFGGLLVEVWHLPHPVDLPPGYTARPGRYTNTGQGNDVPSIMQLVFQQSKSYVFCADSVPRQRAGHSSYASEGRFHSSVLEQGC